MRATAAPGGKLWRMGDEPGGVRWNRVRRMHEREAELLEIHRRYAREKLGPLASAFEVELLAQVGYGALRRPRCPAAVVRAQIDLGFRPQPESERWPDDMTVEQWQRASIERDLAPHRECRRTRRRRGCLLVVARTELDKLEWAGNLVRHVRTRYYLELIDRVVAGDVSSAVSAARRARDRVDIGYVQRIPSYEEVFGQER